MSNSRTYLPVTGGATVTDTVLILQRKSFADEDSEEPEAPQVKKVKKEKKKKVRMISVELLVLW